MPIWLLTCVSGAQTCRVRVNGSTGRIAGKYPLSGWKIVFTVVLVLVVVLVRILASES